MLTNGYAFVVCLTTLSFRQYTSNGGTEVSNELKKLVRTPWWPSLRHYSGICQERLRKTTHYARQNSGYLGQASNQSHLEYETELLQLELVSGGICPL
jgi:hypothetical protein